MATIMRVVSEADFQILQSLKVTSQDEMRTAVGKVHNQTNKDDVKTRLNSLLGQMKLPNTRLKWKAWKLATALLKCKKFNWNQQGQISYNGETDANSNIVDLLKSVVMLEQGNANGTNPLHLPGANLFFRAIKEPIVKSFITKTMKKMLNKF